MGMGRRLARKAVRRSVPRSVWRAAHPIGTAKSALTPRSVRRASRAVYTITNPIGAAQNHLINTAFRAGSGTRQKPRPTTALNLGSGQSVSGGGVRAEEAADSYHQLSRLMAVQNQRFNPASKAIVADPRDVDPKPYRDQEWSRRKGEVRFWQSARKRQILDEVNAYASQQAAAEFAGAKARQTKAQEETDRKWDALLRGEAVILKETLTRSFAGNSARVLIVKAEGTEACLGLQLPTIDVIPGKKAHITPTGRLSSKVWPKSELSEAYAQLLAAHLLATGRQLFAIAPSIQTLRVLGLLDGSPVEEGILFDVQCAREEGDWDSDDWGIEMLENARWGLNRTGKTGEVRPWTADGLNEMFAENPFPKIDD